MLPIAISCSKDIVPGTDQAVRHEFVAVNTPVTKTSLCADGKVYWSKGDVISYYTASDGAVRNVSVTESSSSFNFSALSDKNDTFIIAVYGGTISAPKSNGLALSTTAASAEQSGSFNDAHISVCKRYFENGNTLSFKNATSLIKFSLTRTDVSYVTFTSGDSTKIHGDGKLYISFNGETPAAKFADNEGGPSIKVNTSGSGIFYIATLPCTMKGFSIKCYDANNRFLGEVNGSKTLTLSSSTVLDLGTLDSRIARCKIVGYLPTYRPKVIQGSDWKMCSHINLSFANVNADGTLNYSSIQSVFSSFIKTAQAAGVKVLVSLGGSASGELGYNFATAIYETKARTTLYNSILAMVNQLGLDGIDLDFESWYSRTDVTRTQMSACLEDLVVRLRKGLPEGKLITSALSSSGKYSATTFETFDYVNVMAYDQYGSWSSEPGPHSTYEYLLDCIKTWSNKGIPDSKIVGGVPFYAWSFPNGSVSKAKSYTYAEIVSKYQGAEHLDCVDDYCWYNGLETIQKKTQYILDNKYAGVMIWEIGQDSTDPQKSLLKRIYDTVTQSNALD